jgi:glyoxylate reductase
MVKILSSQFISKRIMKPIIALTRKLPQSIETRMAELFELIPNQSDIPLTQQQLARLFHSADVVVPTIGDVIDASMIAQAGEKLTLIANYGVGIDHIDIRSATMRRITVTNTPHVFTEDTADFVMALLLLMPRKIIQGIHIMQQNQWQGWSPTGLLGHSIAKKTFGIIGLGHVGQAVAKRAKSFGLKVIYHNRRQLPLAHEQELNVTYYDNLDKLLSQSDFISIHCPATPATYHLLSKRRLDLIKQSAYLINTARGDIIDEEALLQKVIDKKIAGVALDVYQSEPHINPQWRLHDNVLLLPHLGSATYESRIAAGQRLMINIQTHLSGHAAPDRIPLSAL